MSNKTGKMHTDTSIKMILDRWDQSIKSADQLFEQLSDDALLKETSPGKNRGIYLLGHLIAVHDEMLMILDLTREMQYPELYGPFHEEPDKAVSNLPATSELRTIWKTQCAYIAQQFAGVKTEEWFSKHTRVTVEAFATEPTRNKLNVVLTRVIHLQYHLGQMVLLK